MSSFKVSLLPAYKDNYIFVLENAEQQTAWVIDPGESDQVFEHLQEKQLQLSQILLTHHHWDHVSGVEKLKEHFQCPVWGPKHADLNFVDHFWTEGTIQIEDCNVDCLHTPGHTLTSYCLIVEDEFLFVGDTLFRGSCGRLFEGSAEEMHTAFQKIRKLNPQLQVFCGHEYTRTNYTYAAKRIGWKKQALLRYLENLTIPSMPVPLSEELDWNPFLNTDSDVLQELLGTPKGDSLACFTQLRKRRDAY